MAALKATAGFVFKVVSAPEGWILVAAGSRASPDVAFDRVTPSPSVLIIHRQGRESARASAAVAAELQAYLWTTRRPSQDRRHQMLRLTRLPATARRCQLGFLSLPYPRRSAELSLPLSLSLSAGDLVPLTEVKAPRAVSPYEFS